MGFHMANATLTTKQLAAILLHLDQIGTAVHALRGHVIQAMADRRTNRRTQRAEAASTSARQQKPHARQQ